MESTLITSLNWIRGFHTCFNWNKCKIV